MKIEKMAQESRVQKAMEEQEQRFGRITRTISGALRNLLGMLQTTLPSCRQFPAEQVPASHSVSLSFVHYPYNGCYLAQQEWP